MCCRLELALFRHQYTSKKGSPLSILGKTANLSLRRGMLVQTSSLSGARVAVFVEYHACLSLVTMCCTLQNALFHKQHTSKMCSLVSIFYMNAELSLCRAIQCQTSLLHSVIVTGYVEDIVDVALYYTHTEPGDSSKQPRQEGDIHQNGVY